MARPLKKPDYNPDKILNEILDGVIEAYENLDQSQCTEGQLAHGTLKDLSDELGFQPSKIKKLLITAGIRDNREIYNYGPSRMILSMYKDGKTVSEMMKATGLKRAAVFGYLPYSKTVYKTDELSTDAERVQLFRSRQKVCKEFMSAAIGKTEEEINVYLWETLELLQGCIFYTTCRGSKSGLRYKYEIRGNEMLVNRKEKSIARSTVALAFHKALEIQNQEGCVSGPKKLGTFGASYLYPIFIRLGVCTASAERSVISNG